MGRNKATELVRDQIMPLVAPLIIDDETWKFNKLMLQPLGGVGPYMFLVYLAQNSFTASPLCGYITLKHFIQNSISSPESSVYFEATFS